MKYAFIISLLLLLMVAFVPQVDGDEVTGSTSFEAVNTGLAYSYPSQTGTQSATITDTGADTLSVPVNLLSDLSYSWYITGTELTGTIDLTVSLQESNQLSGNTDWVEVGTVTIDADETLKITGANTYGVRQRMLITGTGTQTATYAVTARFKY